MAGARGKDFRSLSLMLLSNMSAKQFQAQSRGRDKEETVVKQDQTCRCDSLTLQREGGRKIERKLFLLYTPLFSQVQTKQGFVGSCLCSVLVKLLVCVFVPVGKKVAEITTVGLHP